jgi:enterochelin esterase-like enzyme
MTSHKTAFQIVAVIVALLALTPAAFAQAAPAPAAAAARGGRGPTVVSPEILQDKRVVFRILASRAQSVTLNASDIPSPSTGAAGRGAAPAAAPVAAAPIAAAPAAPAAQAGRGRGGVPFTPNEQGVWEVTVGPVPAGAFRYVFMVDGVRTLDPVNSRLSESNGNNWSLFYIPGREFMDESKDVPHGAVASIYYYSTVLKTMRRMHIYTPPGYENRSTKYPVFYLLHGAGDCDDSWTSVGRAGFILDNLIAANKAKPMIVVMPAGHQPGVSAFGAPAAAPAGGAPSAPTVSPFTSEFMTDMLPYVEKHYRTINDRSHRAIAGLSMGGMQTLDISFRNLANFAYIGVFSSGAMLGGGRGAAPPAAAAAAARGAAAPAAAPTAAPGAAQTQQPDWEATHKPDLDNAALKKGTKLIWLSTGVDDGLITSTRATVDILKKHGFNPIFKESQGAHTWLNWRDYLYEFASQLFQ